MSPDVPDVPPEAEVIRLARKAMDMTAERAAEASRSHDGRGVSAAYWRDVERGYGGRRGLRVPVRASDRALAAMARVVGVRPAQLTEAGREDGARVLEEILRREGRVAPPLSERTSLIAELAPPVAAQVRPVAEQIAGRAASAQAAAPGVPVKGSWVFPRDHDLAALWDRVTASGFRIYPGSGFHLADIAEAVALREVLEGRAEQGNAANGLALSGVTR